MTEQQIRNMLTDAYIAGAQDGGYANLREWIRKYIRDLKEVYGVKFEQSRSTK